MMDRVHRPVCAAVLILSLCAPLAWSEDGGAPPAMPDLAEVLQRAAQARQAMNQTTQAAQESLDALEAGGAKPSQGAPSKRATARGSKKDPAAKDKPQGYSNISVTLEGSFDLHVQDADVRTVLRQLSAQAKKNIVTSSQVVGTVTADLYSVGFSEALDAVTEAAGLTYRMRDSVVYVFTPAELTQRQQDMPIEVRVFHLSYLRAATARDLVTGMLSPKGKATITPEEHTNIEALPSPTWEQQRLRNVAEDVLVVSDYQYVLDKIAKVIEKVDVKPEQVLIEATILSATLDDDNALGVDLQGLIGNNFNTFGMTSDLTDISVGTGGGVNDFSHWQSRVNTNFSQNMPNTFGPPFTFGIVYDNVGAFVQALESVRDVTVLANPKLLVVNKQRGEVLVGREDGYLTTVVTDTSAIQQVEFLETGTKLIVRPFVGKNDVIRLEIHPEDSTGTVEPAEGTSDTSPALPRKTTTQVTTNILVRDGKTVVIAGLFRDEITTTRRQVPILGDVPWMGTLFRSTVDSTTRAEVIILITPHLIQDVSQEAIGEEIRCITERYRIGARKGLRWWGRNRLSAEYLKRANQAWSQGDTSKAQWWLDLCLSLQPDLVEAMLLKERMTDEACWANPPQFTDTRYLVTRMLMQELGYDVNTVLIPDRPLHNRDLRPPVRKSIGAAIPPTRSGVVQQRPRYVATPREDDPVPGAVDMEPAQPGKTPTKPKPQEDMKTAPAGQAPKPKPAAKTEPVEQVISVKPASKTEKPTATTKPVAEAEPVARPVLVKTKPAVKVSTPTATTKPAKESTPELVAPKPATKVKPQPKTQPKPQAEPVVKPQPAVTPETSPAAKTSKPADSPGQPRLAPIKDKPVTPAPESSLSSDAVQPEPAPKPIETGVVDTPTPEPALQRDEIETDLPEVKESPARQKRDTNNTPAAPIFKSGRIESLERSNKSPAQQHLETGTLSAVLKEQE